MGLSGISGIRRDRRRPSWMTLATTTRTVAHAHRVARAVDGVARGRGRIGSCARHIVPRPPVGSRAPSFPCLHLSGPLFSRVSGRDPDAESAPGAPHHGPGRACLRGHARFNQSRARPQGRARGTCSRGRVSKVVRGEKGLGRPRRAVREPGHHAPRQARLSTTPSVGLDTPCSATITHLMELMLTKPSSTKPASRKPTLRYFHSAILTHGCRNSVSNISKADRIPSIS